MLWRAVFALSFFTLCFHSLHNSTLAKTKLHMEVLLNSIDLQWAARSARKHKQASKSMHGLAESGIQRGG